MRLPRFVRRIRPSRPTAGEHRAALERGRELCLQTRATIHIMQAAWAVRRGDTVYATRRGLVAPLRRRGIPLGTGLEDGRRGDLVNVATRMICVFPHPEPEK